MTRTGGLTGAEILPQGSRGGNRVIRQAGLGSEDSTATEVDATKRRTEITIETERVLVVSQRRVSAVSWCDGCGWRVRMVGPEEASVWAGVSTRHIYRWLEAHRLHFVERNDGLLLICLRSLSEILTDACREEVGRSPALSEGS